MSPVSKAVWYIESHFADPVGLDEVAAAAGLSRFHLSRTFAVAAGQSITAYLRGRRLTEAARALAAGAPDILSVALGVGYGSHEAFTRAFRDQFGVTPDAVRAAASLVALTLVEPFVMPSATVRRLPDPDVREEGPFLMAGIRAFRSFDERASIPGQWQAFGPYLENAPGRVGRDAYGVCLAPAEEAEGFDYVTAMAVRSLDDLPEGLSGVRLARRRYAIFRHDDHVASIAETCAAIMDEWRPATPLVPDEGGTLLMIERYDATFDPRTGRGGIEVWIPLRG